MLDYAARVIIDRRLIRSVVFQLSCHAFLPVLVGLSAWDLEIGRSKPHRRLLEAHVAPLIAAVVTVVHLLEVKRIHCRQVGNLLGYWLNGWLAPLRVQYWLLYLLLLLG